MVGGSEPRGLFFVHNQVRRKFRLPTGQPQYQPTSHNKLHSNFLNLNFQAEDRSQGRHRRLLRDLGQAGDSRRGHHGHEARGQGRQEVEEPRAAPIVMNDDEPPSYIIRCDAKLVINCKKEGTIRLSVALHYGWVVSCTIPN